ncbi:hypothetical protein B0H10DRAFT_648545 [Mycena sp. CBHHK59/15]|nr:hypothetical protein B0H10DRAFT_648545 [Mycena sp. CBHHK59/15]
MFIAFRTFRRIILGIILLVSIVSLTLSLYLKPSFVHPNSAYVMVGILDVLIFASILSIFRRTLFDSPQLVATETLGLFTLLPFALILALYVLTVSVTSDSNAIRIFTVLQIFIFIGTILRQHRICAALSYKLTFLNRRSLHNGPRRHRYVHRMCLRPRRMEPRHRFFPFTFSDVRSILFRISVFPFPCFNAFPDRQRSRASKPRLPTWL